MGLKGRVITEEMEEFTLCPNFLLLIECGVEKWVVQEAGTWPYLDS